MFSKSNINFLIGLLIFFSSPLCLLASHLIGGKITYRYLGANKYEYKLTVYRDCSDAVDFNDPALIHIYDKTNSNLIYTRYPKLSSRSMVPNLSPNPCFVPPSGICVEIGTYIDTVNLAPNSSGYTITHQNCCHNASVLNIAAPNATGMVITADIPPQINNSSQFNNFPPIYICQSDTFFYSFASTDSDGDSLVYKLCTPYKDGNINYSGPFVPTPPPYNPLIWGAGFSAINPISNSGGITLNSTTGQFKFKPNLIGQFAIGVCVEEYRTGNLINTNSLELQFNIVNCYLVSSIPTASNLCQGLTINFQNSSTNANLFHWNFGDLSTNADTSNQYTPTYTFPNYGTYTVMLVASNSSYGFCKDTTYKVINVNPLLSPTLQATFSECFNNNNIAFNVGGIFHPSATFNWNFTSNSNNPNSTLNPSNIHFTTASPKTVSVVVNQFGCKDTLFASVTFTNPIASINSLNLNCNEKNLQFPNWSSNASSYFWDFGDPSTTTDTSTQTNPLYIYPSYGNYIVTLIAYSGVCSDTLLDTIRVFPKLQLNWDTVVQKQCFKNNSFNFTPNGIFGSGATFSWFFYNSPSPITSNLQAPTNIHFTSTGNHLIKVSVSENGCTKNAQAVAIVFPDPKANIILSDTVGCEPFTINFKNITDSLHPAINYWHIDTTLYSDSTIFHSFPKAGSYSYSLVLVDANNCTDTINGKNQITINPKPKINSIVYPKQTTILFPQITFIDSTNGTHNNLYSFGDGNFSNDPTNYYSYQNPGQYNYSHVVTNNYGCSDTAIGIIIIDDIASNYIPNVFTPNNDGSNDFFKIKGENILSSSMIIFNRWGTKIFETNDALKGWNGVNENNTVAVNGTYLYLIEITLGNEKKYKFNGTVSLFR